MSGRTAGFALLLVAIAAAYGFRTAEQVRPAAAGRTLDGDRVLGLECYPSRLNFNEIPRGQSAIQSLYVNNSGDQPVFIIAAGTTNDRFQIVGAQNFVPPHSSARIRIAFTPAVANQDRGDLWLQTQPPTAQPAPVPLAGRTSNLQTTPLHQAAALTLTRLSTRPGPTGILSRYLIEVDPLAPSAVRPMMQILPPAGLPASVRSSLSGPSFPLGPRRLRELTLLTPYGIDPNFTFEVCGQATDGGPVIFCDEGRQDPAPEGGQPGGATLPCGCIRPPPALHLKDLKTLNFADPDPGAEGPPPSLAPVARVSAVLWGPNAGECCPGGKFELNLSVDSEVAAPPSMEPENNKLSAWFLASGFCGKNELTLSANTNGKPQAISQASFAPFNCNNITNDINAVPRVVLVTTAEVDVVCDPTGACPCGAASTSLLTTFALGGEESGSIEVHWTVSVSGQDCLLTKSAGKIDKIIFTRRSQVYDPGNDAWLNQTGDPDQDHKSSYDEVLEGGDPNDPSR